MKTAISENEVSEKVLEFKRELRKKVDDVPDDGRSHRGLVLTRADMGFLQGQLDLLLAAHFRSAS